MAEDVDLERYFEDIAYGVKEPPLDYLSKLICPHLVGREWSDIRKAGLLMLLTQNDSAIGTARRRLHTLLVGEPGTGKTEFMLWWRENLEGILINAELCSKTGLVGDARGNHITAGLLADYDGNFVLTDELDKMPMRDQNGLLQAMEEGQYTIVKGKHRQPFKAEVRIIGSTNDLEKIQRPLKDRFDYIYKCSPSSREERAKQTNTIVESFMGLNDKENANEIKRYVEWLGDFTPQIMPENQEIVVKMIQNYIMKVKKVKIEKISYRQLELSILRTAWAMAKLRKSNVEEKDILKAIHFKNGVLENFYGVEVYDTRT